MTCRLPILAAPFLLAGGGSAALAAQEDFSSSLPEPRSIRASAQECSADALPAEERRAMEAEYMRRLRADGEDSAQAWVRQQGALFRMRLVAEGICPPLDEGNAASASESAEAGSVLRDEDGRRCTHTRLENRTIANLGGGGMSMVLVPVCAD